MKIGGEEYLTYEEVAKKFDVSKATVQKWVYNRTIPSIKVGKTRYFSVEALLKWMRNRTEI